MAVRKEYRHERFGKFDLEQLTPRQREVLALTAQGFSMKEVALMLNISVKTVETHRSNVMERLDLHNVPRLVHYAIRTGLIRLEDQPNASDTDAPAALQSVSKPSVSQ